MQIGRIAAHIALVFSCLSLLAAPAAAGGLQCAPFARQVSGVDIRGNANTWWAQAEGRYARGHTPKVGAVLTFAAVRHMRLGHVAMVSRIVGEREVLLTHANWSTRGGIERNVRAVDVSAAGDWSAVRVWYAGSGGLGTSVYPIKGFIYADGAPAMDEAVRAQPAVEMVNIHPVLRPDNAHGIYTLVADTGF